MIPVKPPKKPHDFNDLVLNPGKKWLKDHGIKASDRVPKSIKSKDIPHHWTSVLDVLWKRCGYVCSYLCIFIEPDGARQVDHFVPKRAWAGGCFEWRNFRPACCEMNRKKGTKKVLDPFTLVPETFHLNLTDGKITVNDAVCKNVADAEQTLIVLRLNDPPFPQMRVAHWNRYLHYKHKPTLRELSPFVWYEAKRQGLL